MPTRRFAPLLALLLVATAAAAQNPSRDPGNPGFPDLVGGLKATPGCLGVETAQTSSGKNVIFAWFEDKQAVLNWYHSDMHQGVMKKFFPGAGTRPPLEGVPDNAGPIMAVASLTPADKSQFQETSLPISQISIELYQPINGGIFFGGRFAPAGLKVGGMRDYTKKN